MEGIPRASDPLTAEWATGVFLSCLLILATINLGSPRKWRVLRQAAFRMRLGRQTLRDEVDTSDRNLLGLLGVATAATAMLLWQVGMQYGPPGTPDYWVVFLALCAILGAQAVLIRLTANLAQADGGATEYLYTGTLLYAALGIALLPVVMLAAYWPEWRPGLLWTGLVLSALALLYRWVRGAWMGLGEGVPLRYIFLYLCAAEMLPLALVLHLLCQRQVPAPHT
ncbi:MAG: DUF4271 domain-containing protein [Flavobacteriales bacterium]|nr:DUF4271 domain-containing protein [Flavobacteriales bacterium]